MPQVPVYGGAQVRTAPLQPVQQQTIDVSSGMRVAAGALDQVAGELDKGIRRDAEIEANTVDAEITAGWLKWDADNRRKYQGQNVDEYEAEAVKWWDKARETYGGKLSPLAQRAIGQQIGRKRNQAMGSVLGYVNAEKERAADQQGEAAAATAIEFAVDTGTPTTAASQIKRIVAERGARKGWTTEQVQADQQRLLGTMHLTMIESMAERDAAGAARYYEENKGEIPATAQPKVEKILKGEADNQFAMQFAAERATKPLSEQLADAAKITDQQRREKTLLQIRNNHAMVKAAQDEREAAASDEAWQLIGKGRRVPESVLERMNGRERVQLQEHLIDRAKLADTGGLARKTDWPTYIDAREKLFAGEKVDLRLLTTKIAGPQMEQLLDIQTKVRTPKKAVEVASTEQQVGAFAKQMDLKGEKLGQFQSAAYDLFNEHLKTKGKEPTFDERQVILDNLVKEIVIKPGWLWDTTGPAYQAPRDVRNAAAAPDKFTTGKVYVDKAGNRAKYLGGGKWGPAQ